MSRSISLHHLAAAALLAAVLAAPAQAQVVQFLDVPTADEVLELLSGRPAAPPAQGMRDMPVPQTARIIRDTPDLGEVGGAGPAAGMARPVARPSAPRPLRHRPAPALAFADHFALGSTVLPPRTEKLLDNTGEALRRDGSISILVSGHTDTIGSAAVNQSLSLRRAQAAKLRLVQQGSVAPDRITVLGAGSTQPMPGLSPGAPENRRIQIIRVVAP